MPIHLKDDITDSVKYLLEAFCAGELNLSALMCNLSGFSIWWNKWITALCAKWPSEF